MRLAGLWYRPPMLQQTFRLNFSPIERSFYSAELDRMRSAVVCEAHEVAQRQEHQQVWSVLVVVDVYMAWVFLVMCLVSIWSITFIALVFCWFQMSQIGRMARTHFDSLRQICCHPQISRSAVCNLSVFAYLLIPVYLPMLVSVHSRLIRDHMRMLSAPVSGSYISHLGRDSGPYADWGTGIEVLCRTGIMSSSNRLGSTAAGESSGGDWGNRDFQGYKLCSNRRREEFRYGLHIVEIRHFSS